MYVVTPSCAAAAVVSAVVLRRPTKEYTHPYSVMHRRLPTAGIEVAPHYYQLLVVYTRYYSNPTAVLCTGNITLFAHKEHNHGFPDFPIQQYSYFLLGVFSTRYFPFSRGCQALYISTILLYTGYQVYYYTGNMVPGKRYVCMYSCFYGSGVFKRHGFVSCPFTSTYCSPSPVDHLTKIDKVMVHNDWVDHMIEQPHG